MKTSAKIILHSVNEYGNEIVTFEITFPRFILAELNTHRMLSKNVASSRAIPTQKLIEQVDKNPFVPKYVGANKKGMQATKDLNHELKEAAIDNWILASKVAVGTATRLEKIGCHKQIANRILEPWLYCTAIVTGTEWENFFNLRCSEYAQPEFAELAAMMYIQYHTSVPQYREWHVPYINESDEGINLEELKLISVGRCARVSYLTHDGKRDTQADIDLSKRLATDGHMSPFEHVCEAMSSKLYKNMFGWRSMRYGMPNENQSFIDKDAMLTKAANILARYDVRQSV